MEKVIEGYSGYTVSDDGDVFSTKYKQKRKLKSRKNENGYLYVNLSKDGHYKTYTIHILVAKAFVPNPKNLPQVNHKDANKTNNSASNLEWCTQSENSKHAFKMGLIKLKFGEEHNSAVLTEEKVREIRNKFATGNYTKQQLAVEYNVARGTIRGVIKRSWWKNVI